MNLFIFNKKKNLKKVEERSSCFDYLMYNGIGAYSTNKALLLSTVYRCVEVISDSVAQLPLETYKLDTSGYKIKFTSHPTYRLLNYELNCRMTRFTFIKTLVVSTLLKGNGYAYIERDGEGNAIALHYIPSDLVTIIQPKTLQDNVAYSVTGLSNAIEACNMIYILNFSYDGITLTDSRFRQLISFYKNNHISESISKFPDIRHLAVEFVKYQDWRKRNWFKHP